MGDPRPATAATDPRALAYPPIVLFADEGEAVRMTFCPIPPGRFRMGSRGVHADEEPVHRVEVPAPAPGVPPLWMGETPVTQAQMARWTGSDDYLDWWANQADAVPDRHYNEFDGRPTNPAENIMWWEALGFCKWLTRTASLEAKNILPGWILRATLPAEAHWEYACRAGSETEYHGGDGEAALREVGWFGEVWGSGSTHPVRELSPNCWGLFDTHGNVWEWCRDVSDAGAYRTRLDAVHAVEPALSKPLDSSSFRVVRGGSWINAADYCRSAYRDGGVPGNRIPSQSFRVCLLPGLELAKRGVPEPARADATADGGERVPRARAIGDPPALEEA